MKIKELLKIEPFGEIFEQSISEFLAQKYGQKFDVRWLPATMRARIFPEEDLWICNAHINAIYLRGLHSDAKEIIKGEYSLTPGRPFRSLLQKFYVFLCFTPYIQNILATHFVSIKPLLGRDGTFLIIGGGAKIRFVDTHLRHMYVIKKNSATAESFQNELAASLNFEASGAAQILDVPRSDTWFCQELFLGRPPNRLSQSVEDEMYKAANVKLHSYVSKTSVLISKSRYLENLQNKLAWYVDNAQSEILSCEVVQFLEVLKGFSVFDSDIEIFISRSHGDFHAGNIISSGSEFRIIDWEFSGDRVFGYDFFVFSLGSRSINGLEKRLLDFVNCRESVVDSELGAIWGDRRGFCSNNFPLFLVEDAILFLSQAVLKGDDLNFETSRRLACLSGALKKLLEMELSTNAVID